MTTKRTTENDLVVSGSAAAAAPRRKPARPRAKYSAPPAESPVASTPEPAAAEPALAVSAPTLSVIATEPSHEEVARLAHSYWVGRGCQGGSSEEDWLRAEREIRLAAAAGSLS